eukprot:491238-Amphidinium_carterae.1
MPVWMRVLGPVLPADMWWRPRIHGRDALPTDAFSWSCSSLALVALLGYLLTTLKPVDRTNAAAFLR